MEIILYFVHEVLSSFLGVVLFHSLSQRVCHGLLQRPFGNYRPDANSKKRSKDDKEEDEEYRQHTLTLSYGAAAAEEAYDHDDDAHDDEDVGPHIEEVERLGALHILLEVRVHSHPDTNTKNSAAQQPE